MPTKITSVVASAAFVGSLGLASALGQTTPATRATSNARAATTAQAVATSSPMPRSTADLKVIAATERNGSWFVTVKNVGKTDAVFSKQGALLSWGLSSMMNAGAKLTPGQEVELGLPASAKPAYACPAVGDAIQTVKYWSVGPWTYSSPQPTDAAGNKGLLVDPDSAVTELNETNNPFFHTRPNPYAVSMGTGAPDLIVTKLDTVSTQRSNDTVLEFHVTVKNKGSGAFYLCNINDTIRGSVDGQSMFCIDPNQTYPNCSHSQFGGKLLAPLPTTTETGGQLQLLEPNATMRVKVIALRTSVITDQYGATTPPVLPAGCHEVKVDADALALVAESDECNNSSTFYVSVGGVACPKTKTTVLGKDCPQGPARAKTDPVKASATPTQVAPKSR